MEAFPHFLRLRGNDLKRIARATRGEQQYDDVVNEAWLMAADIAACLGRPADFSDPEFQDLLIRHLYQALVRYTELHVRQAVRLDHASGHDAHEGEPHWLANRLVGGDNGHDPLSLLLCNEAAAGQISDGEDHPSLAGAWLKLLRLHGNRMQAVARGLLISTSYAYRCCAKARWLAGTQNPIPFDAEGLVRRLGPWRRSKVMRIPRQLEFDFEEKLPV